MSNILLKNPSDTSAALVSMWTSFGAKLGEQIVVLGADTNRCEYCLAAHTLLGKDAGVRYG